MSDRAEVVVIGGGMIGLSIAAHLAEDGCDTVLLERGALGSGASRATADVVRTYFGGDPEGSRLAVRSLAAYRRRGVPLHQVGYLVLFTEPEQVEAFEAELAEQHAAGVRVELITADEALRRNPLVDEPSLLAAAWSPDAYISDTRRIVVGFEQAARRAGARLHTGRPAIGIDLDAGVVATPNGGVTTDAIVCAAGPWSSWITAAAGVEAPLAEPSVQELLGTGPLPALPDIPVTLHAASRLLIRRRGEGLLIGMGSPGPDRREWLDQATAQLARTYPSVDLTGLHTAVTGPKDASPNRMASLGRRPGVTPFLHATGFSGHGLCQAPAAGELVRALYRGDDLTAFGIGADGPTAAREPDPNRPARSRKGL
ncbi:NAD(P)/FAD-dependent oxidoreductase [Actinomadura oligospora]|uniref:NAD(P)/FAD-dependent oxidoreductase n=1 Tax=Actinomadura oligospora TaxID=111804 RepID=UPI0004B6B17F|nr:FAD-dependent oxidoreductase [Actinomadura oligospora]